MEKRNGTKTYVGKSGPENRGRLHTASKKLLIGVFIKNEPYGLRHAKFSLGSKQNKLIDIVTEYFASYFENGAKVVPLYEEADRYGQ